MIQFIRVYMILLNNNHKLNKLNLIYNVNYLNNNIKIDLLVLK
jgi:hypothetical protein